MFSLYDDAEATSAAGGGVHNNGHDGDVDDDGDDGDVIEQWFRDANQINNADRCVP